MIGRRILSISLRKWKQVPPDFWLRFGQIARRNLVPIFHLPYLMAGKHNFEGTLAFPLIGFPLSSSIALSITFLMYSAGVMSNHPLCQKKTCTGSSLQCLIIAGHKWILWTLAQVRFLNLSCINCVPGCNLTPLIVIPLSRISSE